MDRREAGASGDAGIKGWSLGGSREVECPSWELHRLSGCCSLGKAEAGGGARCGIPTGSRVRRRGWRRAAWRHKACGVEGNCFFFARGAVDDERCRAFLCLARFPGHCRQMPRASNPPLAHTRQHSTPRGIAISAGSFDGKAVLRRTNAGVIGCRTSSSRGRVEAAPAPEVGMSDISTSGGDVPM